MPFIIIMTVTSSKRKTLPTTTTTTTTTPDSGAATTETVGIRYSCDYCYRDISNIVRIQCAECGLSPLLVAETNDTSPGTKAVRTTTSTNKAKGVAESDAALSLEEVDLCVDCFSAGVEFGSHRKTHAYRILRPLNFAIYLEDWRADEELLLLEAIEGNGIGNWRDIADQLGTRTPEECRQHYMEIYLTVQGGFGPTPLPRDAIMASRGRYQSTTIVGTGKRLKHPSSEECLTLNPTPQSTPANHEVAGFMPSRGEFETEFDNDAEAHIKDLQFVEEDTMADRKLKFALLDIYTMVLEKRAARQIFIQAHGLHEFRRQLAIDKARSKDEREIFAQIKPLARFLSGEDFQRLLDGLVKEEELRRQISHLQELRRHGIRFFEEVSTFETEKKHLELYLKGGSPHGSTFSVSSATTTPAPAILGPIPLEPHPLPSKASLFKKKSSTPLATFTTTAATITNTTATTTTNTLAISQPTSPVVAVPSSTISPASGIIIGSESSSAGGTPSPSSIAANSAATADGSISNGAPVDSFGSGGPFTPASSGGRKASTPLNISHADGVELLSEKERQLCSILRLYPRLYLSIKDTLIREYLKLGGLKRAQARAAVKIDVNKTSKLYDFFVAAGWIKPPESGE